MSTFNLRNQNDPLPETFNLGSKGLHEAYATMPMAGAGQIRRGWESSGLGLRANELLGASNLAATQGDTMRAQTLRQQAEDLQAQAGAWAPRVQNMTDIGSFGDAVDWAGAQVGNIRSSVAPMVGGVVGAGLGGAVGLLARNPALGAKVGGAVGSFSQAFPMMRDESIGEAMMDPEIARTRTAQEIRNTGNLVGVGSGVLESVVPMGIGSGIATLGRKALTNELAEKGAARVIGGAMVKGGGEEFFTEGGQNLVGQAGQNYLRRDDLTDFDYKEALNNAAAGAVGGGFMSGSGKAIEVGGNKLFSGTQAAADTAKGLATNPMQKAGDLIADAGAKFGEWKGEREGRREQAELQRSADRIAERLSQPDVSDADRASALEMIRSGKFMEDDNPFTLTQDDGDVTTDQGKLQADRNVAARATAHADKILDPDYRRDFSEDERIAAARYKAGQTDYNQFRTELEGAKAAKKAKQIADEDFPDVKYSRMTTSGNLSQNLADLWLKKEGQNRKLFTEAGEDGRKLATKVMEWVRSGFGAEYDEDGNHFIPTKLVEELGDDAAKVVAEMARIANAQGVMHKSDKLLGVIDEVKQLAMNKVGDNTFVRSMLTPLAADSMTEAKQKVLVGLLRSTQGKPSKAVRAGLEEMFGPNADKVLAHFTEKASEGRYGAPQKNGRTGSADNLVVTGVDENGDLVLAEELVETGAGGRPAEYDGPQLIGRGNDNRAFDAPVQDGKKLDSEDRRAMERLLQQMGEDRSVRVREVGAWDDIRHNLKGPENEALRREAENDLISDYLPDWMDELGAITTGKPVPGDLNELTTPDRKKLLNMVNQRHRFIVREPNNALSDPGKLPDSGRGSVADLKYKISKKQSMAGVTEADLTAKDGFVFLERKLGSKVSSFPVQTEQLLSNKSGAWDATSETPAVEGQHGAAGISKQALSMLTNIIYSGTGFTGRIGFRKEKGAPLQWLKQGSHGLVVDNETGVSKAALTRTHVTDDHGNRVKVADAGPDNLPGETKLGKRNTVGDAKAQEAAERRAESPTQIAYAENHKERVAALTELAERGGTADYHSKYILQTVAKGAPATLKLYRTIRDQYNGEIDDFGSTPTGEVVYDNGRRVTDLEKRIDARNQFNRATDSQLVDRSSFANRVPSEAHDELQTGIRREDPAGNDPIQRNDDGGGQGFGTDAEGAGYGGNSRGGSRGQAPHSEPVNTSWRDAVGRMAKARAALVRLETARDWAVETLNKKGVGELLNVIGKLGSDQVITLQSAILGADGSPGLSSLNAMKLAKLYKQYEITPKQASAVLQSINENATVLREAFEVRKREVKNAQAERTGLAEGRVRPTDTRGQADARGTEARVADGNQRQRADGESGLGTSGQGQQPDAAGRGAAELLKAYLSAHSGKNAVWENGARNALKANSEKQIAGALVVARKQFGELATTSETPGAKNTLNVYWGAGENKELSNLAPRPFEFEGRQYRSVEHAYQSLKSGEFDADAYARGKTVAKAPGRLGTKTSDGWNVRLMKRLMKASFEANPSAAAALKATGDAQITHNQDRGVWKELFPKLLMEVRAELSTPSETRADTGATTTASVANLVDAAKPPAFAREKEQAKFDGADYVFAPTGVGGSFASRLADAAKAAGKLIDPNGTENIRDKVVYISVPGAGRDFTGMDAFLADVRKLLDRGAIIRTDTKERASSPHNAAGEGKLRQMLAFANLNLTEGKLFDSWQKNLPRVKQDATTTASDSQTAKQDAFVFKIANMSMKDMRAYVDSIPFDKLQRVWDILDTFYPVDNKNAFWQRHDLDTYREQQDKMVQAALYRIEDRLAEEPDSDTKFSRMSTEIHNSLGKSGFAATHDSPIRHEGKFNWRKHSGKGEGNAAFGEGTYLSTSEGVHKSYKAEFTAAINDQFVPEEFQTDAQRKIAELEEAIADMVHELRAMRDPSYGADAAEIAAAEEELMKLKAELKNLTGPGKYKAEVSPTYHVTVNIKPEQLLDWDAPLSEQSEFVKKALRGVKEARPAVVTDITTGKVVESVEVSGETLYRNIARRLGSQAAASDYLQSLGILGHKYAADGGRNDKYPNYVIYDDSKIETNLVQFNKQGNNQTQTETTATPEQVKAAEDFLTKALGESIDTLLAENLDPDVSGFWKQRDTKNLIVLSLKGDVLGTAYHEAAHELFSILTKHGSEKTKAQLLRVATNPIILRKLERLLEKHPDAIKQLSDPEEALAYMFQFSQMGMLKIGPETKTLFQHIKALLRKVAALVSDRIRAENIERAKNDKELLKADAVLQAFAGGSMADPVARQAFLQSLEADTAKHDAAVEAIGSGWTKLANTAGKFAFSAEAMMEATNNEEMVALSRLFHQKAGTEMREMAGNEAEDVHGSYFAGVRGETNKWMNRLENVLLKYSPEDLELARKALATGKPTHAPEAAKAVAEIKDFYERMFEYMEKSDIKRLTERNGEQVWEKVPRRKDYGMTQVWDVDSIMKNTDAFKADLLKHHTRELQKIADQANAEIKAGKGAGAGTASDTQLKSATPTTVTPEMVADAILVRMINSGGQIDLEETTSNLGMTPAATAVNRRTLDWLDAEVFDKYKSKDIAHIMSTYTRNMIKRGEYQKRFGYGGEKIRNLSDRALLREMGGKELVAWAIDAMPQAIEQWKKAKAEFLKNNPDGEFPDPYPTLRLVGQRLHIAKVGNDQFQKDILAAGAKLEQAFKAVQAMEGTLGNDMSPSLRNMNSWLITYQNFRLLSTMLFTSFSDVMGIVANGGELKDGWDAFVNGMREIRNTYVNKKGSTAGSIRAEEWGAVDAGSLLDSLGQTYGSVYMTAKAKRMSDAFFKYTGAEGWNRGIRAVAANTAERIITGWRKNGIDLSDPAKKAQFERLFGKDAVPADIRLDSEERLDINDPANQAAVQRWVLDAVMAPNAANRPIWGSDPHFQTFMHLKNYTYTFHRVMLRGAVEQARLGNFRPAMVLAVGYMPIMIAAGAAKEMLVPGEEPPWMQGGLDGYLQYGWDRAGLLGVPQMYGDSLLNDPANLFGPTVDQIQNALSIPLLDHRTLLGESLGALPGGNLLRRAGQE